MNQRNPRARGNTEGSVYREIRRRADGTEVERWVAQVYVHGEKRRAVHPTEAKAKRGLRDMLKVVDEGTTIDDANLTVAQVLADWQAKALPNRNLQAATIARHAWACSILTEELGKRRVRNLTPEQVETALEARGADGLAKASLAKVRGTLGMALAWAERRGKVSRNVARVAELPPDARTAVSGRAMTATEAGAFLAAAAGTRYAAMWTAMMYLGLRPGEVAGLGWDDVDLDDGIVHVRRALKRGKHGALFLGEPKTKQSVRSLEAPPAVIEALRKHRHRQNLDRVAAGELWRNPDDLVFTNTVGGPVDPSKLRYDFGKIVADADIGTGWTPNHLRHTAASLMSDAGVPLEVVADQLGHRDTRMASLHYRHRVRPTVAGGAVMADVLGRTEIIGDNR